MSITFNSAEFGRVLQQCGEASSRTFPQFLNGQGLRLASFAVRETEKAEASLIAAKLGQVSTRIMNKRTGALLARKRGGGRGVRQFTSQASLDLYRIVNWRRVRAGKKPLGGEAMSKPARQLRAAALRSTGYIAAGWIYAVKGLAKIVGYAQFLDTKVPRMSGKPKGWVNPARFAINSKVTCEIGNTSLIAESADRTGRRKGNPMPIAQRGLIRARDLTARDMLNHWQKKLQPVMDKFSAK